MTIRPVENTKFRRTLRYVKRRFIQKDALLLRRCSSSEVAAMMEGVLRNCTDMEINHQYVDSHGQSEVAFAFSDMLGFDLSITTPESDRPTKTVCVRMRKGRSLVVPAFDADFNPGRYRVPLPLL